MVIKLSLNNIAARTIFILAAAVVCALMVYVALAGFITGVFSDARYKVDRAALVGVVDRFPDSGRLHYRLAQYEMKAVDRDLDRARRHAMLAIELSPYDFDYHLLLASALEAGGDRAAAEAAMREAVRLAPNDMEARWQLANLLVRRNKLSESLPEFRLANQSNNALLPASLDLVWRMSDGDAEAVKAVTGEDAASQITLTRFLLRRSRPEEAVEVFGSVDRAARLQSAESREILGDLIAAGRVDLAREIWGDLAGIDKTTLIRNPGFEEDFFKNFDHFDWKIARSEYARLGVDATSARTGERSLLIEFIGRDTTRLSGEVRQLVVLQPNARYRLTCFVKTQSLTTPEGPRLSVSDYKTGALIAESAPVASGSSDWQAIALDFTAPQAEKRGGAAVYVSIKRVPQFKYDDPTKGIVWFDDFNLTAVSGQ
ncbi:MAG: hypothetical protein AB1631_13460 [Acidobacteriota bacterium]